MRKRMKKNSGTKSGLKTLKIEPILQKVVGDHHPAIRENITWLKQTFAKVVQIHDHETPELVPIYILFLHLSDDLEKHMVKEESVVFPYLAQMERTVEKQKKISPSKIKALDSVALQSILWEHKATQQDWEELRRMTNDFSVPKGSCAYLEAVYWGLKRMEAVLLAHLDLEVNELYKKVEKLGWLR